jgi:hypothetical protein
MFFLPTKSKPSPMRDNYYYLKRLNLSNCINYMSFNGQEGGFFSSTIIVFGSIGSGGIKLTVFPILLTSSIS